MLFQKWHLIFSTWLLFGTCYLWLAICSFFLKLAITCKNLFLSLVVVCLVIFFSITICSYRSTASIKLIRPPNNLSFFPFTEITGHLGAPWWPSCILQHCRWWVNAPFAALLEFVCFYSFNYFIIKQSTFYQEFQLSIKMKEIQSDDILLKVSQQIFEVWSHKAEI